MAVQFKGYAVPKEEQSKSITVTENGTKTVSPDSGKVLSKVTVNANVPLKEEVEKSVTITENGMTQVLPDSGKVLSKVTVITNVQSENHALQEKIVTPSTSLQEVVSDNGFYGLSKVKVEAVTASIDSNITAENIKNGVEILGVIGTHLGGEHPQLYAPTVTIENSIVTIENSTSNGDFVNAYRVYANGASIANTIETTVNLSTLITEGGTYTITVKCTGTNFQDSEDSNAVSFTVSPKLATPLNLTSYGIIVSFDTVENATSYEIFADGESIGTVDGSVTGDILYPITITATNCTYAPDINSVSSVEDTTITFTANENYVLPSEITVVGAEYTWNKSTGELVLSNVTGDVSVTVVASVSVYSITTSITNGSYSGDTSITYGGTATVTITANEGYTLPESVTVIGSDYVWDNSTGTITLSNPTGDIDITVECIEIIPELPIVYSISVTATNGTASADNPSTIEENGTATLTFTANDGYALPESVTVSGATSSWDSSTGTLVLSNPTGDVTITVECVLATPKLSTPANVSADGTIVSWDEVENATSYEIFADGVSIGTIEVQEVIVTQEGTVLTIESANATQNGTEVIIE